MRECGGTSHLRTREQPGQAAMLLRVDADCSRCEVGPRMPHGQRVAHLLEGVQPPEPPLQVLLLRVPPVGELLQRRRDVGRRLMEREVHHILGVVLATEGIAKRWVVVGEVIDLPWRGRPLYAPDHGANRDVDLSVAAAGADDRGMVGATPGVAKSQPGAGRGGGRRPRHRAVELRRGHRGRKAAGGANMRADSARESDVW
mmetsp:Transcript_149570/g.461768  ORF Transcript_149570/g.461768 Transcript_149570/m.461768 type:complete len:201 (-) Transcript_149570:35-637(-)